MKALGLALIVALSLAWIPEPADAGGRRGGGRIHGVRGFGGRQHHGHHQPRRHHHHRAFPHRPFFPVFVSPGIVSSQVVVGPIYTPALAYAPAPVFAAPPVAVAPIPRVVEYPGGRYELRGDGVTAPYVWVWIPDPPAAPPPAPTPPPAPPAEAPEPSLSPRAPARRTMTYRWTDEGGVTTWTDSLDKVPERFRAQASRSAIAR
jgi:hypothetical protein